MQQIVSITDARNNLSRLVTEVANQNKRIVIVRDSLPKAVLVPYARIFADEEAKEKAWKNAFAKILKEGKKLGKAWAKKNKINLSSLTEDEIYDLVKKI